MNLCQDRTLCSWFDFYRVSTLSVIDNICEQFVLRLTGKQSSLSEKPIREEETCLFLALSTGNGAVALSVTKELKPSLT